MTHRGMALIGGCALALSLVIGCSAKPGTVGASSSAPSSASSSASSNRSAGDVIEAMTKAVQQASSVRVSQVRSSTTGSSASAPTSASASAAGAASVASDAVSVVSEGALSGSNYSSDLSLAAGSQVNILEVDNKTYLQANDAYWASAGLSEDLRKSLVGKWVSTQGMIDEATLAKLQPSAVIAEQLSDIAGQGFRKVETATENGREVYRLKSGSDAEVVIDAATMLPRHVKVSARAFPTDLSEWNAVAPKAAPADSQVVKLG